MATQNEYAIVDANKDVTKILAASMASALGYWNNNNDTEPLDMYLNKAGLIVAGDVANPVVTIINSDTGKGSLYPEVSFSVAEGSEVIFTAVPQAGYKLTAFVKVDSEGTTSYTSSPATIKVTKDATVTANWEAE